MSGLRASTMSPRGSGQRNEKRALPSDISATVPSRLHWHSSTMYMSSLPVPEVCWVDSQPQSSQ